jgi:superfamily II DNA or RNA helicase
VDLKRRQAKQKKRERQLRQAARRRDEALRCRELIWEADFAHDAGDWQAAERALRKVLEMRPESPDAHERLSEVYFAAEKPEQGLLHYERLTHPPVWPILTYLAARAAADLGRFDQATALAKEFLRDARGARTIPVKSAREAARLLLADVKRGQTAARREARTAARRTGQIDLPLTKAPESPACLAEARSTEAGPSDDAATRSETPSAGRAPSATDLGDRTEDAATDVVLPPFPTVVAPGAAASFEIPVAFPAETLDLPPVTIRDVRLACEYAALRLEKGFDELLALGDAEMERLWYQVETVRRTLRDFRGRVLLADEVGLGKTIEACLALKEYWCRGLVRRVLILTPPSLVSQWVDELASKFHLEAVTPESGGYAGAPDTFWARHNLVVASLALARQTANREHLSAVDYDLVIVDEAHNLKNRASAAWQLVNALKKRFLFLLSATPIGNNLTELYNLILLLRPGLLSTEARFKREYGRVGALSDPARREKLRGLLREVMVRNTRAHIDLKLPRRLAATVLVEPAPDEARVLDTLAALVRDSYHSADSAGRWALTTLQMEAGSSAAALREGLRRRAHGHGDSIDADVRGQTSDPGPRTSDDVRDLQMAAEAVQHSAKTEALVSLLRRSPEKKIVFTRFLATLRELRAALEREGFRLAEYHGRLTAAQKDAAIARFERDAEVLLASEVGGEGRNLQFCRTVINYDLPWNPMAIEQRVGRVHRIGQTREVYVFNFCLAGSVEQYVLQVLHDKINLFELVAGEMEMILGEFREDADFATIVMDLWAASASAAERDGAFEQLAGELARAKTRYQSRTEVDRTILREDYEV